MSDFISLGPIEENKIYNRNLKMSDIPEELNDFIKSFDDTDFNEDFSEYEYQGFNPDVFYKTIRGLAVSKQIPANQFKSDITLICALVLTRGTDIDKITKRSKESVHKKLNQLKVNYHIVKVRREKLTNETVIMSRFTAAFPQICLNLIKTGNIKPKIEINGLPRELSFNGGVVFIKESNLEMHEAYKKWSIEFDKLINGQNADEEKVLSFIEIIKRSNRVPIEQRTY